LINQNWFLHFENYLTFALEKIEPSNMNKVLILPLFMLLTLGVISGYLSDLWQKNTLLFRTEEKGIVDFPGDNSFQFIL